VVLAGISDSVTLVSDGNNDGLVAKFNNSGACLWAYNIGGTGQDFCNIIKRLSDGSVIIGGGYSNQVDFDPSANDSICTAYNSSDVFLLKLTSNGDFHGLKENSNHELVLIGEFSGQIDLDPGVSNHNLTAMGSSFFQFKDAFLATYDSIGNFIWANHIGGTGPYDKAFDMDLDGSNNIVISGYFGSTSIDMDPSSNAGILYNTVTNDPYTDVFLAKYDVNGNHLWSGSFGGTSSDFANTVDVTPNGEIIMTGATIGNIDFDITSGTHILNIVNPFSKYIVKYAPSGALSWVKTAKNLDVYDAVSSEDGTFFLTGLILDTMSFDGQVRISNGVSDYFIAELGSDGNLMWMNSYGGLDMDAFLGVDLISDNEVVVGGGFKSITDIDPSPFNYEFVGESTISNFLLAKYSLGDLGLALQKQDEMILYPNPNSGQLLTILSQVPLQKVELYDVFGKLLLTSIAAQIDVSNFQQGEYIVRITNSNQENTVKKLIICN
jgi:hypothetical protein